MASRRARASSVAGSASSMQKLSCAPRPTRPRSWWSCARPKRSACSITITVAFGTSTPTSMTVVATSTCTAPVRKPSMIRRRSGTGSWPWMHSRRYPWSSPEPKPGGLRLGGRGGPGVVGLGHERADHVRLAAVVEEPAHPREHLVAAVQAEHARDDRRPPRRKLVEHRHLEVAVDRERERPRDRGRRHVQHVRRRALPGLLLERPPLLDAEAVLLVDHGDAQRSVVDARLDERVGADGDGRLAGPQEPLGRAPLAGGHALHQPDDPHAERLAQRREADQVLGGERLGGRHQRALAACLDGPDEGVGRNGRLARADVALEQAAHRHGPPQVGVDLADGPVLGARSARTAVRSRTTRPARPGPGAAGRWPPPRSAPGGGGGRAGGGAARRRPGASRRRVPPPGRAADGSRAARRGEAAARGGP